MTVRRAINILVDQGVISTAPGAARLSKPLIWARLPFTCRDCKPFLATSNQRQVVGSARGVGGRARCAQAGDLGWQARHLSPRLLCRNGESTFYHREYLIYDPARPLVEAEMEVTSLQGLFEGAGGSILKHGDLTIEATVLNDEEACLLKVPASTGLFAWSTSFMIWTTGRQLGLVYLSR